MPDEPEKIINLAVSPLGAAVILAALEDVYENDAADRAIDLLKLDISYDDMDAFDAHVDRTEEFIEATLKELRENLNVSDDYRSRFDNFPAPPRSKAADIADKMAKASHQAATGKAPFKP
jgi:hypothetical protein